MDKGRKPASGCLGIAQMVPSAADAPGGRRPSRSRFAGTLMRHGRTPNGLQPALKWLIGAASQEAFPWPGLNLPPPLPTNPGLAGLPKGSRGLRRCHAGWVRTAMGASRFPAQVAPCAPVMGASAGQPGFRFGAHW